MSKTVNADNMMVLGNASSRVYTLRCYHATRYIWHHTEHTLLGLEPYPNPLQHTSIAVTLHRYAANDVIYDILAL